MARPIERIEQDILELEKAIGSIAQQLQKAYGSYLEILGQAVRQQLILAIYHLCTQGYPENFLRLSLNQRQKLQQSMRKLAKSAAQDMQALIEDEELEETQNEELEEIHGELEEEEIEEKLEQEQEDLEKMAQELEIEDEDLEEIAHQVEVEEEEPGAFFNPNNMTCSFSDKEHSISLFFLVTEIKYKKALADKRNEAMDMASKKKKRIKSGLKRPRVIS